MKRRRIPEELGAFVSTHIGSVHTLEVLLLLFRQQSQIWSVEEVHGEVKSSLGAAEQSIAELVARGLAKQVEAEPLKFQYAPKSTAADHWTAELANAYAERRTAVIELIYSRPTRAIRSFLDLARGQKSSELP